MKKTFYLCAIFFFTLLSCSSEPIKEIEQNKDITSHTGLSALDYNNKLMMSQSMIHTKIVQLWDAEDDSTRKTTLNDLDFELSIHLNKIQEIECTRTYSPEFKESVKDYFSFIIEHKSLLDEFVNLSNLEDSKADVNDERLTSIVNEFSKGYNLKMDSISVIQARFTSLNKVKLQ